MSLLKHCLFSETTRKLAKYVLKLSYKPAQIGPCTTEVQSSYNIYSTTNSTYGSIFLLTCDFSTTCGVKAHYTEPVHIPRVSLLYLGLRDSINTAGGRLISLFPNYSWQLQPPIEFDRTNKDLARFYREFSSTKLPDGKTYKLSERTLT